MQVSGGPRQSESHRVTPGSAGWPLVGELPAFARNPFEFLESRLAKRGPVFRSRFLSEDVIVLAGPEGWAHFGDPASVTREQAQFPFIRRLLGGKNMGMVDGTEHRMLRSLVATAFTDEALAAYMPTMQALVHDALRLWAQEGEAAWIDGLQRLTLRTISTTMVGAQPEEQEEAMLSTYRLLMRGGLSLPVPLPLTRYGRAVRSVERILGSYGPIVAKHRARPLDDGLTRMLAAERGGRRLTDSEAARSCTMSQQPGSEPTHCSEASSR